MLSVGRKATTFCKVLPPPHELSNSLLPEPGRHSQCRPRGQDGLAMATSLINGKRWTPSVFVFIK